MKTIIIILNIYFCSINLMAIDISREYYNWHFGNNAAITFNTSDLEPESYAHSQLTTDEGTASISDTNGNLLFYTEGVNVWNRNNSLMPKGTELKGHQSSTQSALIVRKPGSTNLYYIFTTGKGPYLNFTLQDFCYSIVDMNEDLGFGDVITKNIKLNERDVVEKLTAVLHSNNKDFWIIAHEMNSDKFIVVLLTENGIENISTQSIGPFYNVTGGTGSLVVLGQLKANMRGDRLAAVCYKRLDLDLYHFDRETGIISDHLPIRIDNFEGSYGVEFSPSGQFVYTSNQRHKIFQFDISSYDKTTIELSRQIIYDLYPTNPLLGALQLAPNGKIYAAIEEQSDLFVINQPDSAGISCDFKFNSVSLIQGNSRRGLPSFCVTEILDTEKFELILKGEDVCLDEDIEIEAVVISEDANYTYKWSGPNGFTSNLPKIKIIKAKLINSGYYVVEIYQLGVLKLKDSIFIEVHQPPQVKIIGQKTICTPDSVRLKVDSVDSGMEYFWSDGTKGSETWVNQPGLYSVVAINSFGCIDTAYFELESGDLDVEILGLLGICENSFTTLKANRTKANDGKNYTYLWSTGDTTESIIVNKSGEYSLRIERLGGCVGYDTVQVMDYPHPDIQLSHSGIEIICEGQSLKIFVTNYSLSNDYIWEDGIIGNARTVREPGVYKIYATSQYNCIDSAEVEVQMSEKPDVEVEFSNDLNICRGDSVIVTVSFDTVNNNIIWEDGSSDLSRSFYESGKFQCVVSNDNGCSDTTEFEIKVFDIEKPEIIADRIFVCELGTPVTLTANQEYHEYLWSNGATTQSALIDKKGIYKLFVYNEIGCSDSAEIEIFIMPMNKPEILAINYIPCDNDTLTLVVEGDYASYLWSDGSTGLSTVVRGSGTYKVLVSNEIGCIDSAEIFIDAIHAEFEFTQSNYEGEVKCTGEESTISLNLRNLTQNTTIINELILENQIDFRIISPTLPITMAANETREIVIAVNSLVPGMFETSIKAISQEPCYFETSTNLSQKFISNISMRLPEINAIAGEQLCIPIYGKINCGASPFVSSASIQISFDAEYFHVNSLKSGTNFTKVIENGICTITIEYSSLQLTDIETLIDELCGVALIGRPEKIPLSLSFDDWANDFIKIESVAGSLKLEACAIEVRGIKYFTPTEMTVSPLPANENLQVTINSGSIGTFELILVGFDGSQEVLRTWENTQTSSVDLLFDISAKSQGVYSLLLKAPWSIHYQQILILR